MWFHSIQLSTTFITSRKFGYLLQCSAVDIPDCQQGSLILGQVFIGTNSNFLIPIGTLIFLKVHIPPKFIKTMPPRIQNLSNKVTFAIQNL